MFAYVAPKFQVYNSDAELNKIDNDVLARIEASVVQAKKDPLPTAKDLLTDVYVSY